MGTVIALAWLSLAVASPAITWIEGRWQDRSDRDGVLLLRPGMPLRLGEPATVRTLDGEAVPLRADAAGWWIDPALTTRRLVAPPHTPIATVDERQRRADRVAWEQDATRALLAGAPLPPPLPGEAPLVDRARSRAGAVEPAIALLGLWADRVRAGKMSRAAREPLGPDRTVYLGPGEVLEIPGEGVFRIGIRPTSGRFERLELTLGGERWTVASTGQTFRFQRRLRAPGAPPLVLRGDPDQAVEVQIRHERLRGWALHRLDFRRPDGGIGAAEWDAIHGVDADFRPWLTDPDPAVATWARVRAIERAPAAELASLCDPDRPGDAAVGHAVLTRATELPVAMVQPWLRSLEHPEPRTLARWLDGQPGSRPHGLALLERAHVPGDRALARATLRHAALHTRWVGLDSDRDDEAVWRFATTGWGIPRLELPAGTEARLAVDTPDPSLHRAVRWIAAPGTRFLLDGAPVEAEGPLRIGLTAGTHHVRVERGTLSVGRRGWEGGIPGQAWRAVPLPARFALPGSGAPLPLRITTDVPVLAVFDDGKVVPIPAGGGSLEAGPDARSLRILPRGEPGRAGVAARLLRLPDDDPPTLDLGAALAQIRDATRAIDGGDRRARARRAVALALVGRREQAWTDVELLGEVDPELQRRSWTQVAAVPVFTSHRGPLDGATARAFGQPDVATALDALHQGRADRAARVAYDVDARALVDRALRAIRWVPVTRADRGGGLIPVEIAPPSPRTDLAARIEQALLVDPWPHHTAVTVRPGAVDRLVDTGAGTRLELRCRDMSLRGSPCGLRALGTDRSEVQIEDGRTAYLDVVGDEVEIGPVEPGRVVEIRARRDETFVLPRIHRLALAVRDRTSITVPRGRLVRIRVLDGHVRPSGEQLGTLRGDAVVDPEGQLTLEGHGTVLAWVSSPGDPPVNDVRRPPRPDPAPPVEVDALWPTVARVAHRTLPPGPTFRLTTSWIHTRDGQYRQPWRTGEIALDLFAADRRGWQRGSLWARAPGGAGFMLERGWRQGRQLVALRAHGSTSWEGDAGQAGLRALGRLEAGPRSLWVRAEITPRAAWVSLQPGRPIDPRVWSLYRLIHYAGVDGRLSLLSEPTRDLRLRLYVQGDGNPAVSADRLQVAARGDLLVARRHLLSLQGGLAWSLADANRGSTKLRPRWSIRWDHDRWWGETRWMLFAVARADPLDGLEAQIGLSLHGTRGRGLRDLPPTLDLFRAAREGRPR